MQKHSGSGNPLKFSGITNANTNVTTSSTLILAANVNRKNAGGFNQSGGVVYVKFGAAAVVGEGVRIPNNEMIPIPEGFTGDVYGIKNAGSGDVNMWEGV